MTVNQKIDEASHHFKMIQKFYPNLKKTSYYYSPFISAIQSIPTYLLNEANERFSLGLPDDNAWYSRQFEEKAKEIFSENKILLNFFNWWTAWTTTNFKMEIGKLFKSSRNKDEHKTKQNPSIRALMILTDPYPDEKLLRVGIPMNMKSVLPENPDILASLNGSIDVYLEKFNVHRRKQNRRLTTSMNISLMLYSDIAPGFGTLVAFCDVELKHTVDFVNIARDIFSGGPTGLEKYLPEN